MTIEYTIVAAVVSALYLIVKKYLPDFPVSDEVFQTILLYLLAKIGVSISGSPAAFVRSLFTRKSAKG